MTNLSKINNQFFIQDIMQQHFWKTTPTEKYYTELWNDNQVLFSPWMFKNFIIIILWFYTCTIRGCGKLMPLFKIDWQRHKRNIESLIIMNHAQYPAMQFFKIGFSFFSLRITGWTTWKKNTWKDNKDIKQIISICMHISLCSGRWRRI